MIQTRKLQQQKLLMERKMRLGTAFSRTIILAACLISTPPAFAQRGETGALAAAEKLLESVGGREVWSQRRLTVKEVGYLQSGEIATIHITRDFETGSILIERTTASLRLVEWNGPMGGWTSRNGVVQPMTADEHRAEGQGFRQEPYAIYHRLARRDPVLRFQLRDDGRTLTVYDRDERVLCWFNLDGQGKLLGWGNHYDGNLNQHFYGPLVDFGNVNLPKFGAASTGAFRFEYAEGNLGSEALSEPSEP